MLAMYPMVRGSVKQGLKLQANCDGRDGIIGTNHQETAPVPEVKAGRQQNWPLGLGNLDMIGTQMPVTIERAIVRGLAEVGYEGSLVKRNIDHSFAGQQLDPVELGAFWKTPADQFTSAVAVRWMDVDASSIREIKTLGTQLWAPFGLIARQSHCELWDALPPSPSEQPEIIDPSILYADLAGRLKSLVDRLGRDSVQRRKIQSRQFALYEGTTSNDVFLQWAFQPTQKALKKLLVNLFKGFEDCGQEWPDKAEQLRLILRFLAVRIAWDKGKLGGAERTSAEAVLNAALTYPTHIHRKSRGRDLRLAEHFVDSMPPVDLGIVDGGTLSQILQMNGMTQAMRKQWKLYPTPADLAWKMVQAIPIERLDENNPVVWDGTCGTGTLLVAALDRLSQLNGDDAGSRQQIAAMISGNDREPLLADLTRINLAIAAGDIDGHPWDISTHDVLNPDATKFPNSPSIILGNPPFESFGKGNDYAIAIINTYLNKLKPGGMISTIMPRTLLGNTGWRASELRAKLLNKLEIHEIWEAPEGFVPHAGSEIAVINARKRFPSEDPHTPAIWKMLNPDRKKSALVDVVPSPDDWINTRQSRIEPPLLLKLRDSIGNHPVLSDLMSGAWITQGIDPKSKGREDVLDREEPGAPRYLEGRSGMDPFNISWGTRPQWIRYDSPNIERPRRSYQTLFKGRKVLLGRRATGGHPWVARAAIEEEGIYPSGDFIAIAPEPNLSCEFICGLLNSALINCWLKLVNPSRTIRVEACRSIPVPMNSADESVRSVVSAVKRITALRKYWTSEGPGDLASVQQEVIDATIALDRAVYDIYGIPEAIRVAIGDYYAWYDKPRPGFDRDSDGTTVLDIPSPASVFPASQASRLRELRELAVLRDLSESEADELLALAMEWEQAYIAHNRRALITNSLS